MTLQTHHFVTYFVTDQRKCDNSERRFVLHPLRRNLPGAKPRSNTNQVTISKKTKKARLFAARKNTYVCSKHSSLSL